MTGVRNVLFVMCDQLRRYFVSCYGSSPVPTPNLDRLARMGVRFDNAFVQSGVCGPARMSYYTGRYVSSHGATWNRVPLSAAEHTLGDYLRAAGRAAALAGKTHVLPDTEALAASDAARRCASACSTGSLRGNAGPPSRTAKSNGVPTPTARMASTSASGELPADRGTMTPATARRPR